MWHNGSIILEFVCFMMSGFIPSHPGLQFYNFSMIIRISFVVVGANILRFYKFHQDNPPAFFCNGWYVLG